MLSGRSGRHAHLEHTVGISPVKPDPSSHKNGVMRTNKISIQQRRPTSTRLTTRYSVGNIARQIQYPSGQTGVLCHTYKNVSPTHVSWRALAYVRCTSRLRPPLGIGKLIFRASDWPVDCDGGITTARYPRRLTEMSRMVRKRCSSNMIPPGR
jgi:hypothetical protein